MLLKISFLISIKKKTEIDFLGIRNNVQIHFTFLNLGVYISDLSTHVSLKYLKNIHLPDLIW